MKPATRICLLALAMVWAHLASAAPLMTSVMTDLGGGLRAFDVYLDDPGSDAKSWFVTDFSFSGDIRQVLAFGTLAASKESEATGLNGLGGYVKSSDTWVGAAWVDFPSPGIVDTSGLFSITGGTGGGSAYTKVLLAHIVAGGNVDYAGRISRYTVPQGLEVSGTLAVPEPAALALVAAGLVTGLLGRRRLSQARRR